MHSTFPPTASNRTGWHHGGSCFQSLVNQLRRYFVCEHRSSISTLRYVWTGQRNFDCFALYVMELFSFLLVGARTKHICEVPRRLLSVGSITDSINCDTHTHLPSQQQDINKSHRPSAILFIRRSYFITSIILLKEFSLTPPPLENNSKHSCDFNYRVQVQCIVFSGITKYAFSILSLQTAANFIFHVGADKDKHFCRAFVGCLPTSFEQ